MDDAPITKNGIKAAKMMNKITKFEKSFRPVPQKATKNKDADIKERFKKKSDANIPPKNTAS